jgi:hypothetical protein
MTVTKVTRAAYISGLKPLSFTLTGCSYKGKTFYPYEKEKFVPPAQCGPGKRNKVNIEAINSDEYPFSVRFYVVVKKNGQKAEKAGEAYANLLQTEQGKDIIKKLQETGGLK